jgi:hypothetical protein
MKTIVVKLFFGALLGMFLFGIAIDNKWIFKPEDHNCDESCEQTQRDIERPRQDLEREGERVSQ